MGDDKKYVSRGGLKLEAALERFGVDVTGKVCADLGCSTGGFTDVLLQSGAKKVYAVDTAYGELAWTLRNDERVVVMERTNAARVELPEQVERISIDISLVPLQIILPTTLRIGQRGCQIIALVKPQYQAKREEVPRGGIIEDDAVRERVLKELTDWCAEEGFQVHEYMLSPITGKGGNSEYLLHLSI